MSVPATDAGVKPGASVGNFYGRSYPRASVLLDGNNEVRSDRKLAPPTANAPLIDWAKRASWKMGGAKEEKSEIQFPRPPFTPVYAFLARKQLHLKQLHPELSSTDTLALAKLNAAAEWEELTEKEQDLYVQLAEQDAVRYEGEVEEFEKEHPGLLTSRKRQTKGLPKASTRPRQPLTAFKAFLLSNISAENNTKLKELRPEAAAQWNKMTEDEKAPFKEQAEDDLKRWKCELDNLPEYKAKIEARLKERQQKQQQRTAKKQIFRAAQKKSLRPGKMGLPKPKPIVRNGKLTRKTREPGTGRAAPATRSSKRQRKAAKKESDFVSEAETEEEDVEMSASDGSDESESEGDGETRDEAERDDDQLEDNEEQSDGRSDAEDEADGAEADEGDVEISDAEEEQPALSGIEALAAEDALDGGADVEEDDDALRSAQTPVDLLVDPLTKDGLFGWAKSALMNGIKGVWGRSQKPAQAAPESKDMSHDERGEALVGRSFVKFFDGKPYNGEIKKYLPQYRWYYVTYEDGDDEELVEADVLDLLAKSSQEARPRLPSTLQGPCAEGNKRRKR